MRAPLAAALLVLLLCLAGQTIAGRLGATGPRRLVVGFLAGAVMLHLLLSSLDLVGVRWSLAAILAPLVAVALLAVGGRWRSPAPRVRTAPLGWGDGLALLALVGFASFAWSRWIAFPDFVYHWGLKGHRFFAAGGVDYAFLARSWNWVLHPDYPNLLPELYASTALLAGRWHEPTLLLWSPWLLGLTVLAVRETLVEVSVPAFHRQAVVAATALACAAFGIAYQMAGAADWLPALALAAALRPLLAAPSPRGDLELGVCAAFAAASKMEGMALAAILVAAQLGRHLRARALPAPRALAALALPAVVVVGHWLAMVHRHHLFQASNAGSIRLQHLVSAWPALRQSLLLPEWHGGPLLLVVALPLLPLVPRLRGFALVAGLQLGFYLWSYAATPVDPVQLVLTTFPRLVLQLWPAILAAAAVAWLGGEGRWTEAVSGGAASSEGGGRPGGAHLDHLGDDGDGDLARRVAPDRQPDGGAQPGAV